MTRCHVCDRPCVREVEPPFGTLPEVIEPDVWMVAMGNGVYVDACLACWQKWPWEHRVYPTHGFGRWPEQEPTSSYISLAEIIELCGEPS